MNQSPTSAARIFKGDLPVLCISESEVRQYLPLRELLAGLRQGFIDLAQGRIQTPPRPEIGNPGKGFSLAMSAWTPGMHLTVKVVNVYENNLHIGLPNHLATINLFDADTGRLLSILDGTFITGVRTAASAVVSADVLARRDAKIATIIGAGVQGREHLRLLPLIREFDEIRIVSLEFSDALLLAESEPRAKACRKAEDAVRDSDIVCLASHAYEPVIHTAWVRPGTHVTSVGYAPPRGELPTALAREHALFVETMEAFTAPPVGCAELTEIDPKKATTLGDVLGETRPGRTSDMQITVYKAMGNAMEDMVAANLAYDRVRAAGQGTRIKL